MKLHGELYHGSTRGEINYMKKMSETAEEVMYDRFGKDSVISLATCSGNVPYVRSVNSFYEDGAFYVLTHAMSNKMKHIAENPIVAISGEWFTAHGKGESLGYFGKEENQTIAEKMREVFAEWMDNGHNNFDDTNTIILRVVLTEGVLFSHGIRYDIDFESRKE